MTYARVADEGGGVLLEWQSGFIARSRHVILNAIRDGRLLLDVAKAHDYGS